jgi:pimeloyl-ACP methyl ester carboxylesterase
MAALAGIVAPIAFALGLLLVTWAEYDFMRELGFSVTDHGDSAWPSGLAQGPHGWAQIANYALFGVLLLAFVAGLRSEFVRRRSRRVATTLLVILGLGFVLAAFPEDGPPFGEPQTWAGYLHAFGFLGVVLGSIGGMLATAAALRGNERWRGYSALSVGAAVGSFVFLFVLVFALEVATTLGIYGEFAVLLAWVELMAMRLKRLSG